MRAMGIVAAVAVAGVAAWLAAAGWGEGEEGESAADVEIVSGVGGRPVRSTEGKKACTEVDEPANFRLYSLGSSFDGLPLTTVMRTCSVPQPVPGESDDMPTTWRTNFVSYIYGDCDPPVGEEGGCAPPLDVQVWPACERHAALGGRLPNLTRRRGALSSGNGGGIELYTADATVVVFGRTPSLVERAIDELQPMAPDRAPAAMPPRLERTPRLPPPAPGAVTGDLSCSRR